MRRIDPASGRVLATIPIGGPTYGIAVDERGLWAALPGEGAIKRIDPETDRVAETIDVGAEPPSRRMCGNDAEVRAADPAEPTLVAIVSEERRRRSGRSVSSDLSLSQPGTYPSHGSPPRSGCLLFACQRGRASSRRGPSCTEAAAVGERPLVLGVDDVGAAGVRLHLLGGLGALAFDANDLPDEVTVWPFTALRRPGDRV